MANLTFQVPDDQLQGLGADADEALKLLRLAAAFHLCGRGKVSTGRAARLAGLSYADFLAAATRHEVDLYHYSLETRRRIEDFLAEQRWVLAAGELLQSLRGVEVLERIDNANARRLLQTLTTGAAHARVTQEARDVLTRLERPVAK